MSTQPPPPQQQQQPSTQRFAQFKLVLLGESAVGKSSIVHRFVKNTFDDMRESTIGAAFLTQSITIPESQTTIKFEIWDTAGQERYKSLAPMYYRNANAALCVYDITSQSSFKKAQDWIKELRKQAPEGIVIALVGNKLDLEDKREVQQQDLEDYISEMQNEEVKIITTQCSAKSGEGVVEIFDKIGRALPVDEVIEANASRTRQGGGASGGRRMGGGGGGVDLNRPRRPQAQTSSCC
ncbi:YPT52 [Candida oxycetoniae]|uniref:YPT52 n=1 Tax=Candida oxycetoniae TaxID=497107 RepID=A0AAI9STC8_9ASCO|nr:YPT52 [Candida oxycetoniae]KAI3402446.2 YPT52 [Candida oxycetoniae]